MTVRKSIKVNQIDEIDFFFSAVITPPIALDTIEVLFLPLYFGNNFSYVKYVTYIFNIKK